MTNTFDHSAEYQEYHDFLELAFRDLPDSGEFTEDQNQSLDEWFDLAQLLAYSQHSECFEARTPEGELVGLLCAGKQSPITWPDGKKWEIFVLAVAHEYRGSGIAQELMQLAYQGAKKAEAQSLLVNTHSTMTSVHSFYLKQGFEKIGVLHSYYDNGDAVFFMKKL